jgi:hypothetical protein
MRRSRRYKKYNPIDDNDVEYSGPIASSARVAKEGNEQN